MLSEDRKQTNDVSIAGITELHVKTLREEVEGRRLPSSRASSAKTKIVERDFVSARGSEGKSFNSGAILDSGGRDSPASQRSQAMSKKSARIFSEKQSTFTGKSSARSQLQQIIGEQLNTVSEENSRLDAIEKMIELWSKSLTAHKSRRPAKENAASKDPNAPKTTPSQDQADSRPWGGHQVTARIAPRSRPSISALIAITSRQRARPHHHPRNPPKCSRTAHAGARACAHARVRARVHPFVRLHVRACVCRRVCA